MKGHNSIFIYLKLVIKKVIILKLYLSKLGIDISKHKT